MTFFAFVTFGWCRSNIPGSSLQLKNEINIVLVPIGHGKTSSVPVRDASHQIFHELDVFECHQSTLDDEEHDSDHWDEPDKNGKIQRI